ncbi:hypothetical protein [Microbacterium soli]|uniref:REDY-like protein HapK n=1 Tax=Microbacterium soli TaxID=446075 RepID=A0ABP7MZU3_9MICO
MLALTLFRLRPGVTVEEYVDYSNSFIKPGMLAMPSVRGFRDFRVLSRYDGSTSQTELIEVIEIESIEAFKHDNETGSGGEVAADWAGWVDDFDVLFCAEIINE